MNFLLPSNNFLTRFEEFLRPLFAEKSVLQRIISNLRRTRDLLLPKLISGEINVSSWVELGCFAVGLLCLLAVLNYLRWCQRQLQHSFAKVLDYRRRDSEAMTYVASYVVPFVTFPLDLVPQILALAVFIAMMLILYVNSNMIYVNPMLNLFGFHLYEVDLEHSDHSSYYIGRKRFRRGDVIHYVTISDEVLLATRK